MRTGNPCTIKWVEVKNNNNNKTRRQSNGVIRVFRQFVIYVQVGTVSVLQLKSNPLYRLREPGSVLFRFSVQSFVVPRHVYVLIIASPLSEGDSHTLLRKEFQSSFYILCFTLLRLFSYGKTNPTSWGRSGYLAPSLGSRWCLCTGARSLTVRSRNQNSVHCVPIITWVE